jgi:hypothetical protein
MSRQTWIQAVNTAELDGSALSNSTTPTSLLPSQAKWLMPANYLEAGMGFRVMVAGRISNIVTTPGTFTLDVRAGGTKIFDGGAMQLSTTAHTNVPFLWEVFMTCRANGSSSNLMGTSRFTSQAASVSGADPTTGHGVLLAPNTAPAVGSNVDNTGSLQIDVFGTFSIANSGNAVTLHQFWLESMN